jgi:carbon storage regulator CsrA
MLVLSRKVDEQIIIGEHIRVTVVSIRGNHVRLGFEAPHDVSIFRQELRCGREDSGFHVGFAASGRNPESSAVVTATSKA